MDSKGAADAKTNWPTDRLLQNQFQLQYMHIKPLVSDIHIWFPPPSCVHVYPTPTLPPSH
jgi:hypothetical protein